MDIEHAISQTQSCTVVHDMSGERDEMVQGERFFVTQEILSLSPVLSSSRLLDDFHGINVK